MRGAITKGILMCFALIAFGLGVAVEFGYLPSDNGLERDLLGFGMMFCGSFLFVFAWRQPTNPDKR